jgi:hypothetical protein
MVGPGYLHNLKVSIASTDIQRARLQEFKHMTYWPLIAKTSLSTPSGAIVVFVIVKVYDTVFPVTGQAVS